MLTPCSLVRGCNVLNMILSPLSQSSNLQETDNSTPKRFYQPTRPHDVITQITVRYIHFISMFGSRDVAAGTVS